MKKKYMIKFLIKKELISHQYKHNNIMKQTFAVIDSGVGGLSVFASIYKILNDKKSKNETNLLYINVVPHPVIGYNKLQSTKRKIEVFNDALYGIKNHFNPDLIFIACNTLSVIYKETEFAKKKNTKVIGIVEAGVNLFIEKMKANNYPLIILGTETTIKSNVHKDFLMENGIAEERIILQACKGLESEISEGPDSYETEILIKKYLKESMNKITINREVLYIGLCCTHYGYAINAFKKVFNELNFNNAIILNPNQKMADLISEYDINKNKNECKIYTKVISKVVIDEKVINNLYPLLAKISIPAAKSLKDYKLIDELFLFDSKK